MEIGLCCEGRCCWVIKEELFVRVRSSLGFVVGTSVQFCVIVSLCVAGRQYRVPRVERLFVRFRGGGRRVGHQRANMAADVGSDEAARYATIEKVGEGAFGSVFRARDRVTGAEVALKRVRVPDARALPANTLRELNALRRLGDATPFVVPLLGSHTHGSNLVLVMPFLPCSLATVLSGRDAPLPEEDAACLGRMLLCGVSAIHAEGLLHRDLKPANLLLTTSGVLLIADLGQARTQLGPHDDGAGGGVAASGAGAAASGGAAAAADLSHAVATRWYRA